MDLRADAHRQASYDVRLDCGPTGAAAIARGADVAVVVDVLSFTTSLGIAVSRGTRVFPFGWKDERAAAYAAERSATLAVGRLEARALDRPVPTLSPAGLLAGPPTGRLVLPSPNGSTICATLAECGAEVVGASLRNRSAVARWLTPRLAGGATVALVAAGERWPDGTLRPCAEDLWGAGAVLDALRPGSAASPEAELARSAYHCVAGRIGAELADCAGGRELAAIDFADDVTAAAQVDADDVVPLLGDDGFAPA